MEKTTFAGLTELDADESVLDDGAAFIGRDREIIDRLLQIGAKTHRHTGANGISNPTTAPSASIVASAGTIGPDLDIEIGYTLEDAEGGETLISPVVAVTTPGALAAPTSAIAAAPDYTAGSLPLGDYYYAITYVDAADGETPLGPVALVEREPGFLNAKVLVSGLAGGLAAASATAWKLYRAVNGGDFGYLASGATSSYLDDGSVGTVGDLTPPLDDGNATNSVNSLIVTLPTTGGIQNATYVRLYLTETEDFTGAALLDRFPLASAGHTVVYNSLDLQDGEPPAVNLSIGGAHQIDPDSELLDWHWKRAVASVPALGSGVLGDVRMVTADGSLWGVLHPSAATSQGWTELGASAAITVTDADGPLEQGVVKLVFGGSGEVSVGVTDLGGGSAKVSVFAPSAQAPPFAESDITGLVSDLAGKQPIDSDLTAIAALATTAYGRALLTLADTAAARASLGVNPIYASAQGPRVGPLSEIDFAASGEAQVATTDLGGGSAQVTVFAPSAQAPPFQESDITGLVSDLAGKQPLDSDLTAIAALSTSPYGRVLLTLTDAAAARTVLSGSGSYASSQVRLGPLTETDYSASGGASVRVVDLGGGSAQVEYAPPPPKWLPSGAIDETMPRYNCQSTLSTVSGRAALAGGCVARRNQPIRGIAIMSSTGASATALTHQWAYLMDRSGNILAKTEDHLGMNWSNTTVSVFMITGGPITFSRDTEVYIGFVPVGTSTLTLFRLGAATGQNVGGGGGMGDNGTSGLSDPASLTSPQALPPGQNPFYAYLI